MKRRPLALFDFFARICTMPPLLRFPWVRRAAAMLGVVLLLLAVNVHINELRSPAIGQYPGPGDSLWRSNLNQALAMSRSWLEAGIVKNNFTLHFMKPRVEDPSPGSPYVSYPPAFVLFPYAFAKVTGSTIELEHLSRWGMLCHFVCALLAALIVFLGAVRWGASILPTSVLAALAGTLVLLMPAAVKFFPFAWWADIVVLPFFLAMVSVESFAPKNSRFWKFFGILLIVLGVLSDWLFFLLVLCLVLKDLSSRPRKLRPELILVPAIYLAWHAWMVSQTGMLNALVTKMELRAGWKYQEIALAKGLRYFWDHLESGMGTTGAMLALLLLSLTPLFALLFFFRHRFALQTSLWIETTFLLCAPMLLHFLLLHQHYYEHPYEVLKLTVLVPLFWLGLLPLLALAHTKHFALQILLLFFLTASSWGIGSGYSERISFAFSNPISVDSVLQRRCQEVYRNSSYHEISFSPDFATLGPLPFERQTPHPKVTEWAYMICNRQVYLSEQPEVVKDIYLAMRWKDYLQDTPYRFVLWTAGKPDKAWEKYLRLDSGQQLGELWKHEISPEILQGK